MYSTHILVLQVCMSLFSNDWCVPSDNVPQQGLSILGYPNLIDLDPVYCMPASVIEAKGLRKAWKALERMKS